MICQSPKSQNIQCHCSDVSKKCICVIHYIADVWGIIISSFVKSISNSACVETVTIDHVKIL